MAPPMQRGVHGCGDVEQKADRLGDADYALEGFKVAMDKFLNAWLSVNPKGGAK